MNQEAAQAREDAIHYLSSFGTGSNMYVSTDSRSLNYVKQVLVFDLGCGASWRVSRICSLYCGVSLGCSQAFYGLMVQTPSGTVISFDSPDYLPNGDKVIASGRRDYWKRFDLDMQFSIGVSFYERHWNFCIIGTMRGYPANWGLPLSCLKVIMISS